MTNTIITNTLRFILLVLLQVLVLNNINFLGYVNPYLYVLFLVMYPFNTPQSLFVFVAFLLGITIDAFEDSGGINAAACVFIAFIRPAFLRFSFGVSYEYQTIKINDKITPERFSFIAISVVSHHFILFLLETFRLSFFLDVLLRTLLSTIFTIIICILLIYLFKPTRR